MEEVSDIVSSLKFDVEVKLLGEYLRICFHAVYVFWLKNTTFVAVFLGDSQLW